MRPPDLIFRVKFPREEKRGRAQDLVGLLEVRDLALQAADLVQFVTGRPGPRAGISLYTPSRVYLSEPLATTAKSSTPHRAASSVVGPRRWRRRPQMTGATTVRSVVARPTCGSGGSCDRCWARAHE